MDESAKRWLAKKASKNLWKVQPFLEYDDLIQEGFWMFYRVKAKYPKVNKRHLMSLFYRSYSNHIIYLAQKRTKNAELLACDIVDVDGNLFDMWDSVCEPNYVDTLIAHAPEPLDKLLRVIQTDEVIAKLRRPYRYKLSTGQETFNDRLCGIIGVNPASINLHKMLKQYLESA